MLKNIYKLYLLLFAFFCVSPAFASMGEEKFDRTPEEETVMLFEHIYNMANDWENDHSSKIQNDTLFLLLQQISEAKPLHHILACFILADLPKMILDLEECKNSIQLDVDANYKEAIWLRFAAVYTAVAAIENDNRAVLRAQIISLFESCEDVSSIKEKIDAYRALFKEDKDLSSALRQIKGALKKKTIV